MKIRTTILTGLHLAWISVLSAADWPMWRYDASRSAAGPEELPSRLHVQWLRQYTQREPVWDDSLNQDLMPLDKNFEPIVMGNTLFLGFNDQDKVVAMDLDSGQEKWTFYTDGPVRLAMAGWRDRLFFTSDDGYLYCLSAHDGKLLWKFRGGPTARLNLGNKRLISSWPARGGVVVKEQMVVFGAGIWPFMGIFLYALEPETGKLIWRNEGTGSQYTVQPHNSPAFAGVAPQGNLAISGDRLLVPSGRSVPACIDLHTGELRYYHLAKYNKTGGAFICCNDHIFFNHYRDRETDLYDVQTGESVARRLGKYPVVYNDRYYMSGDSIIVRSSTNTNAIVQTLAVDASGDLIKSGSRLYAGGKNRVTAVGMDRNGKLKIDWIEEVEGQVKRLVAASGMLVAVTQDGKIIALGEKKKTVILVKERIKSWQPGREVKERAAFILRQTGVNAGYALYYGLQDTELLLALAQSSELTFIALDPDAKRVAAMRRYFDQLGFPARRIHFLQSTLEHFVAPPSMASLIIVNDPAPLAVTEDFQNIVSALRPYGGKLWLTKKPGSRLDWQKPLQPFADSLLTLTNLDHGLLVTKSGPLPGAANWTHQYGNVANTVKSDDKQVKLPLGLLWFGGISNIDVLPRHGHGPPEQIVDGRLIIQGINSLSARDVYTGRLLWKRDMDSLGTLGQYYNESYKQTHLVVTTNQVHIPGANARGTNFVATPDWIYVIQGDSCHALDVETGATVKILSVLRQEDGAAREWGYIGVDQNNLIVGLDFVPFSTSTALQLTEKEKAALSEKDLAKLKLYTQFDYTASRTLAVLDRHSGVVKWQLDSRHGFIHNAVAASGRHLFCLDKLPLGLEKRLQRRGIELPQDYRLLCLDQESGQIVWEKNSGIFGSWLSYSAEYGLLLQATRPSRDMVTDEKGERMSVYHAATGELIWDKKITFNNPPILHHDEIITDNAAYSLFTGEPKQRQDPITGETAAWTYSRNYGCNYAIASEHLLSFRSAAAGFYDLSAHGGTGNFGGFRGGCTSNLIAANGVLNAPDYTRTCQCSYQNQTSLAFVHMPELEYWTSNDYQWNGHPVKRVGLNLNAPGDRVADDGTLWLDFPSQGGKSPDLPVRWDSTHVRMIRRHSLFLESNGYEWVAASGFIGKLNLEIPLSIEPMTDTHYTVKLHFAELADLKPGERKFNVLLQNTPVLQDFDIAASAGGANAPLIKTFNHIHVDTSLKIDCVPSMAQAKHGPLLCGVEIIQEQQ